MSQDDTMTPGTPHAIRLPEVEGLTHEQSRSRRKRPVRGLTISMKRFPKKVMKMEAELYPPTEETRPATRGECQGVERPCPWISCRYNLFLDVAPRTGAIRLNFPDLEPDQMDHSCVLDVADQGGVTLEEVGELLNVTRELVRQMQVRALGRINPAMQEHEDAPAVRPPRARRRLPVVNRPEEQEDSDG